MDVPTTVTSVIQTAPAPPPRVSLVVATVGRTEELERLLLSLARQRWRDFEVLIIDQNTDGRLDSVLARFGATLPIDRLSSAPGLSRSRNVGLAHARGALIAFPDDDCEYREDTLERVSAFFDGHPDADGLSVRAVAASGEWPPARFARRAQWVTPAAVWVCGMSCTIFLRSRVIDRVGRFDERLGLGAGTLWLAAEESDLLLRAVASGARIRYEPSLTVRHPGHRGAFTMATLRRGLTYGRGMAFVMRRHGMSRTRFAYHLLRPAGGAVLAALCGRVDRARFHLAVLSGRWQGWRDARDTPHT